MIALLAAFQLFPDIAVRDLAGHAMRTKEALDRPAAVLVGFTYDSRFAMARWKATIDALTAKKLEVVQMPVYGGLAVLARPLIDAAMARALSPAERLGVWTAADQPALSRALGLDDLDRQPATVLLGPDRHIVLIERGDPTPAAKADFLRAYEQLVTESASDRPRPPGSKTASRAR